MDCNDARPLIQDDLDDRLEAADRERLAGHLESCAACRDAAAELRELRRLFAAVPPVAAPAGLRDAVMTALPRRRGGLLRIVPRRLVPWLGVVAAAAAAVVVAVNVGPLSEPAATDVASAPADAARAESSAAAQEEFSRPRARATRKELEAAEDRETDDAAPAVVPGTELGARDRDAFERKGRADDAPEPTAAPAREPPAADAAARPAAAPPATERSKDAGGKKVADQRLQGSAGARRIVVFSDRGEAERFVAALRGASTSGPEPAAARPPAAPRAPAGAAAAPGESRQRGLAREDAYDVRRLASDHVATAAASQLAEAAASGNARVLAQLSLPVDSPRVEGLLRGALEGRGWAVPLSERLYARARAPATAPGAGGDDAGGVAELAEEGRRAGPGSGPTTGGEGGGGGGGPPFGESEEPESEAAGQRPGLRQDASRRSGTGTTLEIVVLVLE